MTKQKEVAKYTVCAYCHKFMRLDGSEVAHFTPDSDRSTEELYYTHLHCSQKERSLSDIHKWNGGNA